MLTSTTFVVFVLPNSMPIFSIKPAIDVSALILNLLVNVVPSGFLPCMKKYVSGKFTFEVSKKSKSGSIVPL